MLRGRKRRLPSNFVGQPYDSDQEVPLYQFGGEQRLPYERVLQHVRNLPLPQASNPRTLQGSRHPSGPVISTAAANNMSTDEDDTRSLEGAPAQDEEDQEDEEDVTS